jgi:YidC/Oxa1 family membrane protein insertase
MTLDPIAKPIAAILAFFYSLIPNYGIAIVLLTVLVMLILTPLTIKQTRSMLVMQKLQPELKRLQEQHRNDRQALNEAVMALYKEHNASPLGGCLPMLLPFPVFLALFRVLEGLSRTIHGKSVPKYLNPSTQMYKSIVAANGQLDAFGMNLAKSAANVPGNVWDKLPYLALLLVMVGTQYYQQRQLTSRNPAAAQGSQQAIMKFIPVIFGVISIRFPAGVVLYWTVSNGIRILQQWAMYRYDPKVKALVAQDVNEVEAKTRDIDEAERKASRPRLRDLLTGAAGADAGKGVAKPVPGKPTPPKPAAGKPTSGRPRSGKPPASKTPPPPKSSGKPARPIERSRPPKGSDAGPASESVASAGDAVPAGNGKAPAAGGTRAGGPEPDETAAGATAPPPSGDAPAADAEPSAGLEPAVPADQNGNGTGADNGAAIPPSDSGPDDSSDTAPGTAPRGRTGGASARPSSRSKRARRGR